jgi:hypothetical protein
MQWFMYSLLKHLPNSKAHGLNADTIPRMSLAVKKMMEEGGGERR